MNKEYTVSLLGYVIFGGVLLAGIFVLTPLLIIGLVKYYNHEFSLSSMGLLGSIFVILSTPIFLISDAFLAVIFAPFCSYWYIAVKEDGLYGSFFWERLLFLKPRKLCNWEDIVKIRRMGLFDMRIFRSKIILKNRKKLYVTNLGNTPADMKHFWEAKDERDRNMKYGSVMMYAIIMKKIGEDKFERFEKVHLGASDVKSFFEGMKIACRYEANSVIEEDRKNNEKIRQLREQWAKEEKENKQNG